MKKVFFIYILPLLFLSLASSQAQKTIVVATGDYKPFEFKDRDGRLTGYDIELGNEIAKRMGVTFNWKQYDFMRILPALDDGSCQLAIAAIHATKFRRTKYIFSRSYIQTGLVTVLKKSGKKVGSIDDLKGLIVAVKDRSTGEEFAIANGPKIGFTHKKYVNTEQSFEALKTGEVDAVFNDYLSSRIFLKENPDYLIPFTPFAPCGIAIAADRNRASLISKINDILEDLEKEGYLKRLYNKWLL